MMDDMMGAGIWGMGLVWLLVLFFLILAIAALIKYIRR
jgi:Na+-transporting methylmalonyl-CoA/oxaloacetate decarboxylase gamma subunit